jgi:AcrR family transcriptional regulator
MARPVNANADLTRARILGTAGTLFSERGLGQTSIRKIAKDAGVSLGMVHHYFGSKEALYTECIDAMYQELTHLQATLISTASNHTTSQTDLMAEIVGTCFRFARSHQTAVRLVMRQVIETGEIPEERRTAFLLPFLELGSTMFSGPNTRLALQSVVFLIVRFSLSNVAELQALVGVDNRTEAQLLNDVESHLIHCAQVLLLPPGDMS